jgi:RNA polymerase sigma-70 factor (ECF subfamily)
MSFIYDQVSDRGLAEELMQETFVRAYRSLKTLRSETKLSTWLFGIAKNVARESLRARIDRTSTWIWTISRCWILATVDPFP